MLHTLSIQNLILVQTAHIEFGAGLNLLTGETGAGKSAVLSAIRLIAGERADADWIGKWGDFAIIEASMSLEKLPEEIASSGIPATIRRELHRSGKSRCFINDQMVSLSLLKQVVAPCLELIDQSSSHALGEGDTQQRLFDTFAQTLPQVEALSSSYKEELSLQKQKESCIQEQQTSSSHLAWAREDLALIQEVDWKIGEEERIGEEHQRLIHAEEIQKKIESTIELIETSGLKRAASLLDSALRLDPKLDTATHHLKNSCVEMEEALIFLHSSLSKIDIDPSRLAAVEARIAAIEQLKRRFGKTTADVERKKQELLAQINRLELIDESLSALEISHAAIAKKNRQLAQALSKLRKNALPSFIQTIEQELHELNLPHAQFIVACEEKPLSSKGCDAIRFLFSANPGHPPLPIEECASGGELSRLLLAIKTAIADKEKKGCLVFDEIDSNVGGQTASILGEKLQKIASRSQVICVTHFVQVAQKAAHHFLVAKRDQNGLARTEIKQLAGEEKEAEYQRMLGKSIEKKTQNA